MMEDELKLTALDGEFITVEVEYESTATDEELKCTAMEEELERSTIEELKCTAMEVELNRTAVEEEFKRTAMEEELKRTAMEEELKRTAIQEELKYISVEKQVKQTAIVKQVKRTLVEKQSKRNAGEKQLRISCQVCEKTFTDVGHRNYHMRHFHYVEPTDARKNITCPISDCREKFYRAMFLREHIVRIHKIDLEVEELTFQSYENFTQWKENMEKETRSHYVKGQATKTLPKGEGKYILKDYYDCHRTGFYTPNGTGKRKTKRIGSKKIGAFCPSSLVVSRSTTNTYVEVVFWKKHLGHTCDINHLSLTESEKMDIADKISKGMTFTQILDSFKDSVTGSELFRINFLNRSDIVNIANQFKLRYQPTESDGDLVSPWVKKMEEYGNDSPVAFFKNKKMEHEQLNLDDFMLVIMTKYQIEMGIKYSGNNVCIDSVHGISLHGFYLTTLLSIDECSAVFPLAFCISNKTDEVTMMVFFDSVKRFVGAFDTPVFMSNDDPVFYNAWEKIMAPASFQLLCKWHVDSCWRRNLSKINDKDKQASVYKILRMLLEESDVFEFESRIKNFVTELEDDVLTKKFAEYFSKDYIPRIKMWAFCYMRHLGISSVAHLEAMHTSLHNLFINGNNVVNGQIHKVVPDLLKVSRDELLRRLDKLLDCLPMDWTEKIKKTHQQGLTVCKITPLNENSWSVKLFKRVDDCIVTANEACSNDCYLKCLQCNICIHSFFCTCYDNLLSLNICRHMHACAVHALKSLNNEEKEKNRFITDQTEIFEDGGSNELSDTSVEEEVPSSSKTLLTNQLNTIKTMMDSTDFTDEQASQLKNSFDAIISFMMMHGKSKNPTIQVPYKPAVNYISTVQKPEHQHQNQMIATGQPLRLYIVNNFQQT